MKKTTTISLVLLGLIFLAGCSQKPVSQISTPNPPIQQTDNNPEPKNDKSYSYCKPDEDPNFKLAREDDLYYYYTGDKSIRGVIYQQNASSHITWDTHINQSCKFELTNNYVSNIDMVKNDSDINDAWENQPHCNLQDGSPYLEGVYTIHIEGFKVPKSYIQEYDPRLMRDKLYMSKFSFYVDYDRIEKVDEKSQVKCPIVLY